MYKEECVNVHYIGYFSVEMSLLFFLTHLLKVICNSLFLSSQLIKMYVLVIEGFTLLQTTKALRESRGIALLYFRPLH